jgi:peptide chain release factor 2
MKFLKLNKKKISEYQDVARYVDDLEVLDEFFRAGDVSEEEVETSYSQALNIMDEMEFHATLSKEEDSLSCIMEINAGAGGTEACDWAAMIERMYLMWSEKNGYKVKELERTDGDVAGIKSVSLEVNGDYAYGYLKGENGIHRLVRISPFNAQGKRQTSFASVFAYPLVDDTIKIEINPADLEMDVYRASGAGGQHVNRTESAVRLRHLPSGVVVACQDDRSQHANREKCMQMLRSKLFDLEIKKRNEERDKIEAGKNRIEWGSQIRSYVLDDRRVKDHRTGFQTGNTDAVLDGEIDGFLKSTLLWVNKGVTAE